MLFISKYRKNSYDIAEDNFQAQCYAEYHAQSQRHELYLEIFSIKRLFEVLIFEQKNRRRALNIG